MQKPKKLSVPALQSIPEFLREQRRWAVWSWDQTPQGKWSKVPKQIDGENARNNCWDHWGRLQSSLEAAHDEEFAGLAFNLGPEFTDDPRECNVVAVLDLDKCLDMDKFTIKPWAEEILKRFPDTYAEISPSMTGIKIWFKGPVPAGDWKGKAKMDEEGGAVEFFYKNRYLCFTGNRYAGRPLILADADTLEFREFLLEHFAPREVQQQDRVDAEDIEFELRKLGSALAHMSGVSPHIAEDYDVWIKFGTAIHNLSPSEDAFLMWDAWSQTASNYDGIEECRAKWESFGGYRGTPVTVGTIYHLARELGWEGMQRQYELSDMGTAKRLKDKLQGRAWYIDEKKAFIVWDGTKFAELGMKRIMATLESLAKDIRDEIPDDADEDAGRAYELMAKKCTSAGGIRGILDCFRWLHETSIENFDTNHSLLPVQNGVLKFGDSVEFGPHDPSNMNTKVSPVVYNPQAQCPRWEKYIDEVTGGDLELADYLQKLVGLSLTGTIAEEAVYMFHGDGSNGKSLFVETIMGLLGEFSDVIKQSALVVSRYGAQYEDSKFPGRRFIVCEETEDGARLNENHLKMVASRGRMTAREIYGKPFSFEKTHKLFLTTNHLPFIRGTDVGIWRRIRIIPFTQCFLGREEAGIKETLQGELSGILNWAIKGYMNWMKHGLKVPKCSRETTDELRDDMDPLGEFFETRVAFDGEAEIETTDLLRSVNLYLEEQGYTFKLSTQKLGKEVARRFGIKSASVNRRGIKVRVYPGMRLATGEYLEF